MSAGTELPARRGEGESVPPSTLTFSSPVRSGFYSPLAFPHSSISENNNFKKTPHNHKKLLPGVCTKQTGAPGLRTGPRVLISLQQERGTGHRQGDAQIQGEDAQIHRGVFTDKGDAQRHQGDARTHPQPGAPLPAPATTTCSEGGRALEFGGSEPWCLALRHLGTISGFTSLRNSF